MTASELASKIDHTILKPEATAAQVQRIVAEVIQFRFASACIAPAFVRMAAGMLHPAGIPCCTVIGFPHGTSKSTIKAIEATSAVKDGADEIDIVAHLPHLLSQDVDAARAELVEIVRASRATRRNVVIKVIVESALLMAESESLGEARIAAACRAVRESGCDFIKTSTGFHPAGGASIRAVQLMKKHGQGLLIKAAGSIRDLATAQAMLDAGADRLGMSASIAVITQLTAQHP
ncbi:MAG: deoxyribose-phosphate aldolase [Bacillota bacterium]